MVSVLPATILVIFFNNGYHKVFIKGFPNICLEAYFIALELDTRNKEADPFTPAIVPKNNNNPFV
ncbi:hypothetical protein WDC_1882 [Paucilactobacillus wasatchensis]|uniref:Uncharacterized protein n=1 Tax=Paucilactobacillus wasatchensis TaxID=1335616 RepID=A0A0D1A787_9LACO|nr:hypothetical protein WDC_1882 [Paucilactobacillus wasatchensis]